jgi:hypothetical protein
LVLAVNLELNLYFPVGSCKRHSGKEPAVLRRSIGGKANISVAR